MNAKTMRIFLGGGGNEEESKLLDERFVETLDLSKPLIYIPNAMNSIKHQSCLKWFRSIMNPFGVTNIEMWNDLRPRHPAADIAGVYIGGGNTVKLLREIREANFDKYLYKMVREGIPLYGGSAGAIILGEDIRTAPEASQLNELESEGLGVIKNSFYCHYKADNQEDVVKLSKMLRKNIVAIPEKSGAYITKRKLINYGTEPLVIVTEYKVVTVDPGCLEKRVE